METADNSKLNMADSSEVYGLEEKMDFGKNCVSDHVNGFQYTTNTESFVIDMDAFSNCTNKEITSNSRIPLQRSYSRKGFQRGGEKKKITSNDRDLSSPRGAPVVGSSMLENQGMTVAMGSADKSNGPQVHHQITIKTGNMGNSNSTTTSTESCGNIMIRRNSLRRTQPSWLSDPRRVMIFFATLSSMGTIVLILFTLSIGNLGSGENGFDYP